MPCHSVAIMNSVFLPSPRACKQSSPTVKVDRLQYLTTFADAHAIVVGGRLAYQRAATHLHFRLLVRLCGTTDRFSPFPYSRIGLVSFQAGGRNWKDQ